VILSTALVPTFLLSSNAVSLSARIRNDLIAANLAQEGVEIVRAVRDANWFEDSTDPLRERGLDACANGCAVQYDDETLTAGDINVPLRRDADTGLYQYGMGEETPFRRAVTITPGQPSEIVVSSRVSWRDRSGEREVVVEYHLFDWLQ
jgi:hypothetical protein